MSERAQRGDAQRGAESLAKKPNTSSVGVRMVLSPPPPKSWNISCTSRWLPSPGHWLDLGRDTRTGLFLVNPSGDSRFAELLGRQRQ